jgi:protein kinase C substrate 80K-H
LSRLSDGICDCCDGADEGPGVCPDICDELLRAEREARAKLEKDFEIGHNKRKHELFKFKQFRKEKLDEIERLRTEKATLDPQAPLQKAQGLKLSYAQQRMKTAQSIVAESTLLVGITASELQTIVVLSCQIAGEVAGRNHGHTCAPLRLAGMEFSMIWGDDNYNEPEGMKIKDDISQLDWATRVFQNAARNEKSWTLLEDVDSKKNTRRRLEEVVIDDDFGDYDGHHGDDDYMINDHDEDYSGDDRVDNLAGLELEMIEGIRALSFSTTRRAFLKRSAELREEIAAVLKPTSNNESDTNETINPVDPAAYDMIKSSLGTKETAILKGFKSGASASLFFSVNKDLSEDQLRSLAMYTIYHGNLSALQVWHILLAAVDDLKTIEEERSNEQTCVSPSGLFF